MTEEDRAVDKLRDLSGQGTDDGPVPEEIPEEVKVAQEELMTLEQDKQRTENVKRNLEKELDNAKEKAAKIEEVNE